MANLSHNNYAARYLLFTPADDLGSEWLYRCANSALGKALHLEVVYYAPPVFPDRYAVKPRA